MYKFEACPSSAWFTTVTVNVAVSPFVSMKLFGWTSMSGFGITGIIEAAVVTAPDIEQRSLNRMYELDVLVLGGGGPGSAKSRSNGLARVSREEPCAARRNVTLKPPFCPKSRFVSPSPASSDKSVAPLDAVVRRSTRATVPSGEPASVMIRFAAFSSPVIEADSKT